MRLKIAEAASVRYGWPLQVIEDAGHFVVEQPEAFRRALRAALALPPVDERSQRR
jgi:pimeloyl-ACP methyl ester carboxylesterase